MTYMVFVFFSTLALYIYIDINIFLCFILPVLAILPYSILPFSSDGADTKHNTSSEAYSEVKAARKDIKLCKYILKSYSDLRIKYTSPIGNKSIDLEKNELIREIIKNIDLNINEALAYIKSKNVDIKKYLQVGIQLEAIEKEKEREEEIRREIRDRKEEKEEEIRERRKEKERKKAEAIYEAGQRAKEAKKREEMSRPPRWFED